MEKKSILEKALYEGIKNKCQDCGFPLLTDRIETEVSGKPILLAYCECEGEGHFSYTAFFEEEVELN